MSIHPIEIDGLTYDLNFICDCITFWVDNGEISQNTFRRLQNNIVAFEHGVCDHDERFTLPIGHTFGNTERREVTLLEYMVFTWDLYHEIDFETADETFEESIIDDAPEIFRDDLYYMVMANGDDNVSTAAQADEMMLEPIGELEVEDIWDEALRMVYDEELGLTTEVIDLTEDDVIDLTK